MKVHTTTSPSLRPVLFQSHWQFRYSATSSFLSSTLAGSELESLLPWVCSWQSFSLFWSSVQSESWGSGKTMRSLRFLRIVPSWTRTVYDLGLDCSTIVPSDLFSGIQTVSPGCSGCNSLALATVKVRLVSFLQLFLLFSDYSLLWKAGS